MRTLASVADGLQEPQRPAFWANFSRGFFLSREKPVRTGEVGPLAAAGSSRHLARSLAHRAGFPGRRRPRALAFRTQDRVEALQLGRIRGTGPGQVAIIDLMLFRTGTNGQGERRFTAAGFR